MPQFTQAELDAIKADYDRVYAADQEQNAKDEAAREAAILELAEELDIIREGECELGGPGDSGAMVSEGDDNGAYVRAWVWVSFANTPLDKDKD